MKPSKHTAFKAKTLVVAVMACFSTTLYASGAGMAVINGTASSVQNGNTQTITNSNGAIIHWDSFSILANETIRFDQPSATSSVLNRVVTSNPSVLLGTLSSNGRVFLINPAGIMVGAGAQINVAGFVASTLNISDQDFLAGKLNFIATPNAGKLTNSGAITTPTGGSVYLVAPQVENSGTITTPGGETILAAGQTVHLIDTSTPGVKVEITGDQNQATNLGTIVAESGRIGIAGVLVKNSGALNANSVVSEGGRIFLRATKDTLVDGNSRISATGVKGGQIEVLGNRVAVMDNAQIDVSGSNGGGTVLVGGDYQGKNPDVQNAQVTYFGPQAAIKADATDNGNGGKIIVWADDTTRAYGTISAKGGANGGNGGFVETSGHRSLDISGAKVDTTAPIGHVGNWLLDPTEITIVHSGTPGTATFTSTVFDNGGGATTTLNDYDINANLANNDITITTTSAGGGPGDIKFDGSASGAIVITNASGATRNLTLTADNDIRFVGGSSTFQTTASGLLGVNFNPGAGRKVEVQSGATAIFNGFDGSGFVAAFIGGASGKTWENYGTVTLSGVSYIDLNNGVTSTFNNHTGGTLNLGSTQGWAIQSWNVAQADPINNAGTINVTTGTAIEAAYSQASTGTLNIANGQFLNLQNAISLSGGINLNASGTLNLNENHGTAASLTNLTFSGAGGTLGISGSKVANLSGVSATNVGLTLGSGAINLLNGDAAFKTITFAGGSLGSITNGTLGVASGNFAVPSSVTYSGNAGYMAAGNLTVNNTISTSGNLLLAAGWDGVSTISAPVFATTGDLTFNSGAYITSAGAMSFIAGNLITLNSAATSGTFSTISHTSDWGTFSNNYYGSYTSGGDLAVLAGGGINLSGVLGSAGNGNTKIIAGWNRNLTTPNVVGYTVGKDITITGGLFSAGSGAVSLAAADKILITDTGSSRAGIDMNSGALSISADKISLTGMGSTTSSYQGAKIAGNGDQSFTLTGGSGATSMLELKGGNGANILAGSASIERFGGSGGQSFTFLNGSKLNLQGGSGNGLIPGGQWTGSCSTGLCSANYANIENYAAGGQTFTFSGAGGSITLLGGSTGNDNFANINNRLGAQSILGGPAISISGGSSGGTMFYDSATNKNINLDNGAGIDSKGSQTINAASITMAGGNANYGGAYLGSPSQVINVVGAVTMTGGAVAAPNAFTASLEPIFKSGAFIGSGNEDASSHSLTLTVGSLTMNGGATNSFGGSPAVIGGYLIPSTITINSSGDIALNGAALGYDKIGSWGGYGGSVTLKSGLGGTGQMLLGNGLVGTGTTGSVTLEAYGTGAYIGQSANGQIFANTLSASTSPVGSINLTGSNLVNTVTSLSTPGNLAYTSAQSVHIGSATSTGGNTTLTTTGAGNNLYLGTASGAIVNVTSAGGIYDDNGSGVTNITASTSSTLISTGATLGNLGISADVNTPNIAATVSGSYGGISIRSTGASAPTVISLTDSATTTPQGVSFYHEGANPFTLSATTSFLAGSGALSIGAVGTLNWGATPAMTGSSLSLYGGTLNVTAAQNPAMDLSLSGGTVNISNSVSSTGSTFNISGGTVNISAAASSSGSLFVKAGNLAISSSALSAANDVIAVVDGDIRINGVAGNASISAGNNVELTLNGANSTLYLNDVGTNAYTAKINAGSQIFLDFLGQSTGGVVINGTETLGTSTSGFFVAGNPAALDTNLIVTYGVTNNAVQDLLASTVTEISSDPGITDDQTALPPPPPTGSESMAASLGTDTIGGTTGTFGGDSGTTATTTTTTTTTSDTTTTTSDSNSSSGEDKKKEDNGDKEGGKKKEDKSKDKGKKYGQCT